MHKISTKFNQLLVAIKKDSALDVAVIVSVLIFTTAIWLPTRYLPFHWDGAGFFNTTIQDLIDTNFKPLITTRSDFSHPPLLYASYAVLFTLLGRSLLLAHLIIYPFLPLMMISTYYIAKKISQPVIAVISTFLVGFTPVILAEYGVVYIDLPAAALAVTAIALWLYQRKFTSMVIFSLAILTKFTALIILPLFVFIVLSGQPKPFSIESVKKTLTYFLIPLTVVVIWLGYHYSQSGWLFSRPERTLYPPNNLSDLTESITFIFRLMFINQGRWPLTAALLISLAYSLLSGIKLNTVITSYSKAILSGILVFLLFFAFTGEFELRYGISITPFVYILFLHTIFTVFHHAQPQFASKIIIFTGLVTAITMLFSWHPQVGAVDEFSFKPPADLAYRDMIDVHRQAALYLQLAKGNAQVYGGFPENIYTTEPAHGYLTQSLNFSMCRDFQLNPDVEQIVYFHPFSPSQIICRDLLILLDVDPIQRFESNDFWVELYQVNGISTQSATLTPQP